MTMYVTYGRVVVAVLSLAIGACGAGETDSRSSVAAHFKLSDETTAADVGLPTYPGARAYRDADDSNSAANLGLSTLLFGFKVVAMNLEAPDKPERIAAFYRQALPKYGTVQECSDAAAAEKKAPAVGLECDSDEPGTHSIVYKVGTKENQRIVAIKPHGNGTRFSLVHVDVRGGSKR